MKKPVVDNTPREIKGIEFGLLSQEELEKISVLELHERYLYDLSKAQRPPMEFGALDRRLGVANKQDSCTTCGGSLQDCVGHFGIIKLSTPVFHIGLLKFAITVLQSICKSCSRILLHHSVAASFTKKLRKLNIDSKQRNDLYSSILTACKATRFCHYCGSHNGLVKKVGAMKIIHEKYPKKITQAEKEEDILELYGTAIKHDPSIKGFLLKAQEEITPIVAFHLFDAMTPIDCLLAGMSSQKMSPCDLLWRVLPVPPVCIRPSIGQDGSSTEDDITILLSEIVEVNNKIASIIETGQKTEYLMEYCDYLQLQCAMYVTSDLPGIPLHLQGNLFRIKKGLCQRLKGKSGRFRGNLSGKRVDFSGRTVISPDPNVDVEQIVVPERIARVLTYPERVMQHNIEQLRKNVANGVDVYPGAAYVTKSSGIRKFLKYGDRNACAMKLEVGDVVERHLRDDDIVLFNRQPSLHKLSIMAHKVVVRPWRTLRFNECVCTPYNADFDGDEMNLHVPQTEEAKAEASVLMDIKSCLVSPRNGEPLIAATQDFITSSYLITNKDVFLTRAEFVQTCCSMNDAKVRIDMIPPAILKPRTLWTGKQVYSMLLNMNKGSNTYVNVSTKCRNFDKSVKNIHGVPFSELTTRAGGKLDNSLCPYDNYMIVYNGELLCGVVDKLIIGEGSKNSILYTILCDFGPEGCIKAMNYISRFSSRWLSNRGFSIGIDDVQPNASLNEQKFSIVKNGYDQCESLIRSYDSGTLTATPGCTAEETLEGKISGVLSKIREDVGAVCLSEFGSENAALVMSKCGSKGSKINVSQMVACVGQQIIFGNRISDGFPGRTLPHFRRFEKTPVAKGFVQNSFYSGLTPTEFFFHAASGREGLVDTSVKTAETGYMQRRLMKALEDLVVHYDGSVRNSLGSIIQFKYGDDGRDPTKMEVPEFLINLERVFIHCYASIPASQHGKIILLSNIKNCVLKLMNTVQKNEESMTKFFVDRVVSFIEGAVQKSVVPTSGKRIRTGIPRNVLIEFVNTCKKKYFKAKVDSGTAVGAVAAQSIGEPGTQMVLKTFHFAGVASMNITLGVPRIKEIINASKSISTPIITVHLQDKIGSYDNNSGSTNLRASMEASCRVVKSKIEQTSLREIIDYIRTVYNSEGYHLVVKLSLKTIETLHLGLDSRIILDSLMRISRIKLSVNCASLKGADKIVFNFQRDTGCLTTLYKRMFIFKEILLSSTVCGISTIVRAVINDISSENRLNILAEGYGLLKVMNIDGVDYTKTKSNHIFENLKVLGIEAARATIIDEIVYTMRSHGMVIDLRHVMLLADLMTFKGEVLSITRFGISNMKDSVLMLASFERTTNHLFEAAFCRKFDSIIGVSERIIMGLPMRIGTGMFKMVENVEDIKLPPREELIFHNLTAKA